MDGSVRCWHWGDPVAPLRRHLAAGGVVAIPSESSYGLAVDPRSPTGVAAVDDVKGRAARKPLPVVAADLDQLAALGVGKDLPELAVAGALWPAPLTVLVPLAAPLPATAGAPTLAVRIPAHRRLRELLAELGCAVTATSANRAGQAPALAPAEVTALLSGREAIVVDDGPLAGGPPSTLVAWPGGKLRVLRQGAYPIDRLPRVLSPVAATET